MKKIIYIFFAVISFTSCNVNLPDEFSQANTHADIYPTYRNITIPYNIAPLNFKINEAGDKYICRISCGDEELITDSKVVKHDIKKWRSLLENNKGKELIADVFVKKESGWVKYLSDTLRISEYPIDSHISYRLIEPSYVSYEDLSICQRDLTTFNEKAIYRNTLLNKRNDSQCINCHSFQNNDPNTMQFHVRQYLGGTVVMTDGEIKKVNLKNDNIISGGVYPAWHPKKKLIAYSVNNTNQSFHTRDAQKIEVFDTESDLILYDVENDVVYPILVNTPELEVFPTWSPDGTYLYYCVSDFKQIYDDIAIDLKRRFTELRYDIYRMSFDTVTYKFGEPEPFVIESENKKSATFPRFSPCGNYLLYTCADYGVFHVWHKSSDLKMFNVNENRYVNMDKLNSDDSESYHSWSTNGKWVVFSSRREDGSYTRPYISYINEDGEADYPFILPQKDPDFYGDFYKSYNIPEFMTGPVTVSSLKFKDVIKREAKDAIYRAE